MFTSHGLSTLIRSLACGLVVLIGVTLTSFGIYNFATILYVLTDVNATLDIVGTIMFVFMPIFTGTMFFIWAFHVSTNRPRKGLLEQVKCECCPEGIHNPYDDRDPGSEFLHCRGCDNEDFANYPDVKAKWKLDHINPARCWRCVQLGLHEFGDMIIITEENLGK